MIMARPTTISGSPIGKGMGKVMAPTINIKPPPPNRTVFFSINWTLPASSVSKSVFS